LVEPLYVRDGKNDIGSQSNHSEFYSYISSIKSSSSIDEWQDFCRNLYFHIAKACKRLQKRSIPEIYPGITPGSHQDITVRSPRSHASFSSEDSFRSSKSSPSPPLHTEYARPSALDERSHPFQQTSTREENHIAPQNNVNILDFTSMLKEYVDREGGILMENNVLVSLEPMLWRCRVSWGNFSSEGEGRNKKQARYAASRKMYTMLRLPMD
jgi:hypothetical protein